MGYTLMIGELIKNEENEGFQFDVENVEHLNAPAEGSPTDYTNSRWPSYSGWSDFVNETGLSVLNADLIKGHPGYTILKPAHKEIIDRKFKQIKKLEPHNQARLSWLKYWVDWALENCKQPAFLNR